MSDDESLTSALLLGKWHEKSFDELPPAVQERARRPFSLGENGPLVWDHYSPDHRLERARHWDYEHDSANDYYREKAWNLQLAITRKLDQLEREIELLEVASPSRTFDSGTRKAKLVGCRRELAGLQADQAELLAGGLSELHSVVDRLMLAHPDLVASPVPAARMKKLSKASVGVDANPPANLGPVTIPPVVVRPPQVLRSEIDEWWQTIPTPGLRGRPEADVEPPPEGALAQMAQNALSNQGYRADGAKRAERLRKQQHAIKAWNASASIGTPPGWDRGPRPRNLTTDEILWLKAWDSARPVLQAIPGQASADLRHMQSNGDLTATTMRYDRTSVTNRQERWRTHVKAAGNTDKALIAWAREKYPDGVPGREDLLRDHRTEFEKIDGISEKKMRIIRKELASPVAKEGGKPTHRTSPKTRWIPG